MELRQLRYFVRVVELGSMGRAALERDAAAGGKAVPDPLQAGLARSAH